MIAPSKIGELVMGYRSALLVMAIIGPILDLLDGLGLGRTRLYAWADAPYGRAFNIVHDAILI
jgi:hypothetical protein